MSHPATTLDDMHIATVVGHIVYSPDTSVELKVPFCITIGDTCCEEHAVSAAKFMVEEYAKTEVTDEGTPVVVRYPGA